LESIVKHYGAAIVTVVSMTLLAGILGGLWYLASTKEKVRESISASISKKESSNQSKASAKKVMGEALPELHTQSDLHTGNYYQGMELLLTDEKDVNVRILRVWDIHGVEVSDDVLESEDRVYFSKEGVYRIEAYVERDGGNAGTMEYYLGVNA